MVDGCRGFQVVEEYQKQNVIIPQRKTANSAGYDIASAVDVDLPPHKVTLVPTGLKAYMQPHEYLGLYVRSSLALQHQVCCINSVGVIDADYYNNEANEGHIMVALINHDEEPVHITKGMRVAQGIFTPYLTVDGDEAGTGASRQGGFGSTGA